MANRMAVSAETIAIISSTSASSTMRTADFMGPIIAPGCFKPVTFPWAQFVAGQIQADAAMLYLAAILNGRIRKSFRQSNYWRTFYLRGRAMSGQREYHFDMRLS